ncbi:MAG: M56 family metallopeptidase [Bacteroidetes bacterium]|nr:M56 family metallopeptidase [Bacteroidota bacterium]
MVTSLMLSFTIPVITLGTSVSAPSINRTFEIVASQPVEIIQTTSDPDTNYLLLVLIGFYALISILFFFRFVRNLKNILSLIRRSQIITLDNSKIILINEDIVPHSFLNFLFISSKDFTNGAIKNEIIVHEQAHIQQKHSYDNILIEVVQIFFWFNPFILLYKKAIRLNHEFLADEKVINSTANIEHYQYLLINMTNNKSLSLTSQFNYSLTKKRLIMMTKQKSFRSALYRQIAIIPVVALSLLLFSNSSSAQTTKSDQEVKKRITPSTQEGVTKNVEDEYSLILEQTKDNKGCIRLGKLSERGRQRLQTIYLSMNKEQQAKQNVVFVPVPKPSPKIIPTLAEVESWKDSKVYGVWVDDKRVSNSELNEYKNTDFAQVFVSRLEKNSTNYGKHFYQVNLMTKDYYTNYYNKATERVGQYYIAYKTVNKIGRVVLKVCG